ncbi:MAG TPA: hypothetical protein VGM50_09945 [Gemmatimonadaceae bacterium]
MATRPSKSTAQTSESRLEREERMFDSLPSLGSPDYIELVKTARREAPPACVLVRAYRQLFPSDASDTTLARLVNRDDPPGYLVGVVAGARQRARRHAIGAYTADDLVANTIGEIAMTLAGPKGSVAERLWALYLEHCMEDAYRVLVGRGGLRLDSHAATQGSAENEGGDAGTSTDIGAAAAAWRARVEPSHLEWLESFIERTIAKIANDDVRAIGLDLFSEHPMPVSGASPKDPNTLTGRFGVNRYAIYRMQSAARAVLYDALDRQDERDIDLSFLNFGR